MALYHQMKISPGFRFLPHDDELLKILLRRVKTLPIHDFDIYCVQPSQLPPALEKGAKYSYFFTPKERKFGKGSRADRCTRDGAGYWRMTSSSNVYDDIDDSYLGRKNTLVYFRKKKQDKGTGRKTGWIMHEFALDERLLISAATSNQKVIKETVICRIYENVSKKRRQMMDEGDIVGSVNNLPFALSGIVETESSFVDQFYSHSTLENATVSGQSVDQYFCDMMPSVTPSTGCEQFMESSILEQQPLQTLCDDSIFDKPTVSSQLTEDFVFNGDLDGLDFAYHFSLEEMQLVERLV